MKEVEIVKSFIRKIKKQTAEQLKKVKSVIVTKVSKEVK